MQLIAHRAPPSAGAARQRVADGATMFEVDVQLRSGVLVSSHYLPLHGRRSALPVERDNWRLRWLPARGDGGDRPAGARDAPLTDVLARIPAGCGILLDPKHHPSMSADALLDGLVRAVATRPDPDRFVVSTSNPRLLAAYRAGGLRTWRSIGDRAALTAALGSGPLPEPGVSIRHSLLDAETVAALRAVTGIIVAWTVNSPTRARQLADLGVGAITTDSTAVLAALRRRTE